MGTPRPVGPPDDSNRRLGGTGPDGPLTAAPGSGTTLSIAQQNCRPTASTAADFQAQFDQRGPVWGGGDGAEPIPIDNGRTLWLFGDTYLGSGTFGGPLDNRGFVHNSMVVQYNGSCFAYLLRGNPGVGWYSAIAEPSDTDYYWPTSGAYDASAGVLSVTAMRVHHPDRTDPWGWQLLGTDVIHYRISDMAVLGTERLFTYSPSDVAQFGTNLLAEGSFVYHYGCAQATPTQCYVARTDRGLHGASLRFLGSGGWVVGMQNASADRAGPAGGHAVARGGDGRRLPGQQPDPAAGHRDLGMVGTVGHGTVLAHRQALGHLHAHPSARSTATGSATAAGSSTPRPGRSVSSASTPAMRKGPRWPGCTAPDSSRSPTG